LRADRLIGNRPLVADPSIPEFDGPLSNSCHVITAPRPGAAFALFFFFKRVFRKNARPEERIDIGYWWRESEGETVPSSSACG